MQCVRTWSRLGGLWWGFTLTSNSAGQSLPVTNNRFELASQAIPEACSSPSKISATHAPTPPTPAQHHSPHQTSTNPDPTGKHAGSSPFRTSMCGACAGERRAAASRSPCMSTQPTTFPVLRSMRAMQSVCHTLPHSSPSMTSSCKTWQQLGAHTIVTCTRQGKLRRCEVYTASYQDSASSSAPTVHQAPDPAYLVDPIDGSVIVRHCDLADRLERGWIDEVYSGRALCGNQ